MSYYMFIQFCTKYGAEGAQVRFSKGEHIQVSQHQVVTLSLAVSKTLAVNCLLIVKLVKVGARLNTKHHQLTITKIY